MARVVIVGASLAGLRVAEGLRRGGFEGPIVLIGDEAHAPYDRPPLSKEILAGTSSPDDLALAAPDTLSELGLDVRLGVRATDVDLRSREVILHGGASIAYDELVITTGSRPRRLPGRAELDGVHTLRTVDDAVAIRDAFEREPRVVVVGAGFIGAEVASAARSRGLSVTVLEALPVPLARGLGPRIGALLGRLQTDAGVDLRCSVGVSALEGDDQVEAVRLSDGSAVPADLVVVGVGATPNTQWLEASGLTLNDGVVCDSTLRAVGHQNVWAAGDVCRWHNDRFGEEMRIEHWTNAGEQAAHVAAGILGDAAAFAPLPYVWSDQFSKRVQIAGRVSPGDEVSFVEGDEHADSFAAIYSHDGQLRGAVALDAPKAFMRLRRALLSSTPVAEVVQGA